MKSRQKKKLVELYQDETLSETDANLIFLASALLMSSLVFFEPFSFDSKNFSLIWYGFLIGVLISLVNIYAWKNAINSRKDWKNVIHFFIFKTGVLLSVVTLVIFGNSSFLLSVLAGFMSQLSCGILMIILLFIKRGVQ